MSQNQMTPTWLVNGTSMATSFTSSTVQCQFGDNIGFHIVWTGTPTGTITIQVSMDPDVLGWHDWTFSGTPTQPSGSASHSWLEINQATAGFVRLKYTASSGSGTMKAKIAIKSV